MADWKITWRGASFTADDLVGSDLSYLATLTGDGWGGADPWRGPAHTANLIAVFVSRTTGRPMAEVLDEIAVAPAVELVAALGLAQEVPDTLTPATAT